MRDRSQKRHLADFAPDERDDAAWDQVEQHARALGARLRSRENASASMEDLESFEGGEAHAPVDVLTDT